MEKVIFNGKYIVYSDGKVFSVKRKHFLKPQKHRDGYIQYNLSIDNKIVTKQIHRILAEAFIPNPNNLPQVNHKNLDKTDNRIENLEWCTRRYNQLHRYNSKYHNIHYDEKRKKYRVHLTHNKKFICHKRFSTIEEAIKVRDEYIRLHNL
jgi:hypothetical protein